MFVSTRSNTSRGSILPYFPYIGKFEKVPCKKRPGTTLSNFLKMCSSAVRPIVPEKNVRCILDVFGKFFLILSDLSKTLIITAFLRASKSKSNIFRPSVLPYFHTWWYIPKIAVETEKMNQCTSQLDPKLKIGKKPHGHMTLRWKVTRSKITPGQRLPLNLSHNGKYENP